MWLSDNTVPLSLSKWCNILVSPFIAFPALSIALGVLLARRLFMAPLISLFKCSMLRSQEMLCAIFHSLHCLQNVPIASAQQVEVIKCNIVLYQ